MRLCLLVVVVAAAGCECTYPFSVDTSGAIEIPLGIVADCTGSGTIPADGQADADGNLTRFTHGLVRVDGGLRCVLHAEWSGPLVDVEELRADAEDEMEANGIDPDHVDVRITAITPSVATVALRGAGTSDPALVAPGVVSYRAAVSIEGDPEIIVVTVPPDGDVANPAVAVKESARLVELANEAWATGAPIPATGTADVSIDVERVGEIGELPAAPRLRVDFAVTVEGDAAFDG